ncbi:MAG: carbohydrate ABC transporter permease [Defluviitaleaceae bacterium]|nr:carbohydrate ABC transporter permease [Defluviitaleaceae bacterium]
MDNQAAANTKGKIRNKPQKTGGQIAFNIINYTVFGLFTLACIYPFYFLIINSISANNLSAGGHIIFYPREIQFQNYVQIFKLAGLPHAALISIARVVIGTLLPVMVSMYLGYMFTQENMWHRKFWYRFILVTMYFSAGIVPVYITFRNLHLLNNFLVYVLPGMIAPFYIMLAKTYLESIPASLQESAEIDGAGKLKVFFRIMLPLAKPIIASIAIFVAVGQWNSFMDTVIYVTRSDLQTLQSILWRYLSQTSALAAAIRSNSANTGIIAKMATQATPTSVQMTITVVVILPILIIYPYFQRFFVKGIMIGAVKG